MGHGDSDLAAMPEEKQGLRKARALAALYELQNAARIHTQTIQERDHPPKQDDGLNDHLLTSAVAIATQLHRLAGAVELLNTTLSMTLQPLLIKDANAI